MRASLQAIANITENELTRLYKENVIDTPKRTRVFCELSRTTPYLAVTNTLTAQLLDEEDDQLFRRIENILPGVLQENLTRGDAIVILLVASGSDDVSYHELSNQAFLHLQALEEEGKLPGKKEYQRMYSTLFNVPSKNNPKNTNITYYRMISVPEGKPDTLYRKLARDVLDFNLKYPFSPRMKQFFEDYMTVDIDANPTELTSILQYLRKNQSREIYKDISDKLARMSSKVNLFVFDFSIENFAIDSLGNIWIRSLDTLYKMHAPGDFFNSVTSRWNSSLGPNSLLLFPTDIAEVSRTKEAVEFDEDIESEDDEDKYI